MTRRTPEQACSPDKGDRPILPYWLLIAGWLAIMGGAACYAIAAWTPITWAVWGVFAVLMLGLYWGEKGSRTK